MLVNMVNNTTEQYYSLPESWCQLTSQCVSGWVKLNPFNCVKSVVRYVGKVDLKFYRFSTWFTTVSRQCRYSAGRRRASTSIKFSRGLTCLHAHLYVKCRQVNNCIFIHPILGRPITNLGCQNPSVTGSSDAKLVSEVLGQLHTAWRTPRHFFVFWTHWQGTTEFLIVLWPESKLHVYDHHVCQQSATWALDQSFTKTKSRALRMQKSFFWFCPNFIRCSLAVLLYNSFRAVSNGYRKPPVAEYQQSTKYKVHFIPFHSRNHFQRLDVLGPWANSLFKVSVKSVHVQGNIWKWFKKRSILSNSFKIQNQI